jgi:predicted GNAT family acetyltransferase
MTDTDPRAAASETTPPSPAFLRCVCGWETIGAVDEVVAATDEHGRRVHNMAATRDEILGRVETIADNPAAERYELHQGGRLAAVAEYRTIRGTRVFHHTEVDPEFEGRGMGSRLARHVLDDVRARGFPTRIKCPFLLTWIKRHPEYGDLIGD